MHNYFFPEITVALKKFNKYDFSFCFSKSHVKSYETVGWPVGWPVWVISAFSSLTKGATHSQQHSDWWNWIKIEGYLQTNTSLKADGLSEAFEHTVLSPELRTAEKYCINFQHRLSRSIWCCMEHRSSIWCHRENI